MMEKGLLRIAVLAVLICGIITSCAKDDTRVIPRKKMARIYAEMLVTDQWITSTPGLRMVADTSLVYEPILEKYGYDSDDYRKSIDVYMDDPERFARILRTAGEILQERINELEKQQKILDMKALLPVLEYDIDWNEFFPYIYEEPYVHNYDSITFEPDSVLWIYRLKSIERSDTIYDRLRMIIPDTLSIQDTIAVTDSLEAAESIVPKKINFLDVKVKDVVSKSQVLKSPFKPAAKREKRNNE